ncbi:B-cell linker protein [Cheilinus undulatus]|uniref:B-cell linker protein n=1 Tax=Cheilinus undulatus TaxID=241271 RepID=UPI001BD20289|nr:B-cell linker protein [Cheilinus undulatus]
MTMSFFGKRKNLGPPAPPRRTDDNEGWPPEEFDDDEEDSSMYEVPPCERLPVQLPQRAIEENVYLDTTSNPTVPQRQAAPPMGRPLKHQQRVEQFNFDTKTEKPPEIDRTEKPGRKKLMPPTPARPSHAPAPAHNTEEDVYLYPDEEQEVNDGLYLEPTDVRMSQSPKTTLPSPKPLVKPPVPRPPSKINLTSSLPSQNEIKTAEVRRVTFPTKVPPPTHSKPPLPANLKEVKLSHPAPPPADTKPVVSSGVIRTAKQLGHENKEWFAGDCNRKKAEDLLERVNKDGAFLIRHSSAQSARQPYTLAVLYQQKVYNIPIRFLGDTQGYALGKEGKKNEEIFVTLEEMISHHKNNQLLLIDSKSQAKHTAYLTHPARP